MALRPVFFTVNDFYLRMFVPVVVFLSTATLAWARHFLLSNIGPVSLASRKFHSSNNSKISPSIASFFFSGFDYEDVPLPYYTTRQYYSVLARPSRVFPHTHTPKLQFVILLGIAESSPTSISQIKTPCTAIALNSYSNFVGASIDTYGMYTKKVFLHPHPFVHHSAHF